MQAFATQAGKTLVKAKQYRAAAMDNSLSEVDRVRLLAAARAIEINGIEWVQLARRLVK